MPTPVSVSAFLLSHLWYTCLYC